MKNRSGFSKIVRVACIFFFVLVLYHLTVRPWMLDWGAPEKIRVLNLSGDRLTNNKWHTRAILIQAPPERIWPWIIQLGQERGGFYSYTWLENLFLANMHNVYSLNERLQLPRTPGDTIWLADKKNYNGKGFQILAEVIQEESFVMVGGDDFKRLKRGEKAVGSWNISLYAEDTQSTWLIARSSADEPLSKKALRYFTFEIPHFIMEQKMLRTIKELSENNSK